MYQNSTRQTASSEKSDVIRNDAMLNRWVQEGFRDGPYHAVAFVARQSATSRDGKSTNGSKFWL
jgi:hypothetical protein